MKVWLNNLKEGDIFYHILFDKVYKCKHLGDAHNMNFRMSRIKYEILDNETIFNEDLLDNVHEAFVNQYVYDNKEEAINELLIKLKNEINSDVLQIAFKQSQINDLEKHVEILKNKLKIYGKQNNKENIG